MNLKFFLRTGVVFCSLITGNINTFAQVLNPGTQTNGSKSSNVITAVPFLLITPDSRAAGMGEAGVAVLPDANSMSINPSKLAFLEKQYGFSVSYSPWLKNIVDDVNLVYVSGYLKVDGQSAIGGSLRYFSLGAIQLIDANQASLGTYSPNEYALDISYSRKFGETFALGTALRYIRSGFMSGQFSGGQDTKASSALAVDVSAYFKQPTVFLGTDAIISAGVNISNIGTKMSYAATANKYFLPANMKIGAASTFMLDEHNQVAFALDFNKLLVPTQPDYDTEGQIIAGKDPNRSVPAGIFGSFSDSPGGFNEELKEINMAAGMEYLYRQQFAFRTGYFFENPRKGDRRYFTLGAGLKINSYAIDFSYLLASTQRSPLANTLRFSLLFNFGN